MVTGGDDRVEDTRLKCIDGRLELFDAFFVRFELLNPSSITGIRIRNSELFHLKFRSMYLVELDEFEGNPSDSFNAWMNSSDA